jgi:Type II secretion system (T2SS), protein F
MASVPLVALAWGVLVFVSAQRFVRGVGASDRARALRTTAPRTMVPRGGDPTSHRETATARTLQQLGPLGRVLRGWGRLRAGRRREAQLARELPAAIDLLAVAVSAGATPFAAVETAARWAPPVVGSSFAGVLATCRLGASFELALSHAARRDPGLAPLTAVLATGARLGAAVNDSLARLAAESRRDLRRRAEARARTVPVRLLFPLVFLVLPAFGLLTVVPAVAAGFRGL